MACFQRIFLCAMVSQFLFGQQGLRVERVPSDNLQGGSSALRFYRSLLAAAEVAQGRFHMDLSPGAWRSDVNGRTVLWTVFPGTTMSVTITRELGGQIRRTRFEFYPRIAVALLGMQRLAGTLGVIEYTAQGGISSFDLSIFDEETNAEQGLPVLMQQFVLLDSASLLQGLPFAASNSLQKCSDGGGTKCAFGPKMITHVEYESVPDAPLHLVLQAGKTIHLGLGDSGEALNAAITLAASSEVVVSQLDFDAVEQTVTGSLARATLAVSAADYGISGMRLASGAGALSFDGLTFAGGAARNGRIEMTNATLAAACDTGSVLRFAGSGNAGLELSPGARSRVELHGLHVTIDDQRGSRIEASQPSTLQAQSAGGVVSLGRLGFLKIGSGQVSVQAQHLVWASGAEPVAQGSLSGTADFNGGLVFLRPDSSVPIESGSANVSLKIDTSSNPAVTGAFGAFRLNLRAGSDFTAPGGVSIHLNGPSTVVGENGAAPISIAVGSDFPFGGYVLSVAFDAFKNVPNGTLTLRNGTMRIPLAVTQAGAVKGQGIEGTATMRLAQDATTMDVPMTISNASLQQASPNAPGQVSAPWVWNNMTIPTVQTITVPGKPGSHDAERFFPVTFQTSIPDPFNASGSISWNGSAWENQFSGNTSVLLRVPAGSGEYRNRDHPEQGATGNVPFQEVWRDDFVEVPLPFGADITCTKHLYVVGGDYRVSGLLEGDQVNGVMKLKMENPQVPSINTWDDGCGWGVGGVVAGITELGIQIAAPFTLGRMLGEWHTVNQ